VNESSGLTSPTVESTIQPSCLFPGILLITCALFYKPAHLCVIEQTKAMSGRLSTLCALCTDLFSYEGLLALSAEAGFAYESFDQVKCQAAEGCALCSFLSGFSHAAGQKPAFTLRATQWFGAQPHDPQFYHYKIGGDTKRLNHPFHDQPLAHVECRMESGCITWYAFAEEGMSV